MGSLITTNVPAGRDVYRAEHGRGEKGRGLWENSASIQFCCEQL